MIYKLIQHPYDYSSSAAVTPLQDVDHSVDGLLQFLASLPAAQQIDDETAEDILHQCLLQQAPYVFLWQPMQKLGMESVRKLLFDALDWCR
jgi:hypothetical protein